MGLDNNLRIWATWAQLEKLSKTMLLTMLAVSHTLYRRIEVFSQVLYLV